MRGAISFPWIRQMRVTIKGLNNSADKIFDSDGSMDRLRIDAVVTKSIQHRIAVGSIDLWNLAPHTRAGFTRDETKVTLEAGWRDGPFAGMNQMFKGKLLASQHRRMGADIVTTLYLQGAQSAAVKVWMTKTYAQGTPWRNIVLEIARKMEPYGVRVDPKLVIGIKGVVGEGGYSFGDTAGSVLTRMGSALGFWWTTLDDQFQTVSKDPNDSDGAFKSTAELKDPYLIGVGSDLTGVRHHIRGVSGECLLNPGLRPGHEMNITSTIDTSCNGNWRVTDIEHRMSCFVPNSFITSFTGKARVVSK